MYDYEALQKIKYIDNDELYTWTGVRGLESMATYLIEQGYEDAAKETLELLYHIKQTLVRSEVIRKRLGDVWEAAASVDSGNNEKDQLEKQIKKYRGDL